MEENTLLIFLAQLALMGVFVISALAKASTPDETARAARDFGAPEGLSPWVARLLPAAELIVAAALFPLGSPRLGGLLASVLLMLFTA